MTLPYSCALYNLQCTNNVTDLSGVLFYTKTVLFHTVKNEASNFQKQTELKTKTHLFVFKRDSPTRFSTSIFFIIRICLGHGPTG